MKIESTLWSAAAVFFVIAGTAYFLTSGDPAGTSALAGAALFGIVGGGFATRWQRQTGPRAEDRADATMADETGEVGYFPSSSFWPLPIAAGVCLLALGAIFAWWTAIPGALLVTLGVGRLLDESMHRP